MSRVTQLSLRLDVFKFFDIVIFTTIEGNYMNMKTYWVNFKQFWLKLVGLIYPSQIPVGVPAMEKFSNDVLDLYKIPNLPSYHHAIASMVMHMGPQQTRVRKGFIAKTLHKAMANQVAFSILQKLKEQEDQKANVEAKATHEPVQV